MYCDLYLGFINLVTNYFNYIYYTYVCDCNLLTSIPVVSNISIKNNRFICQRIDIGVYLRCFHIIVDHKQKHIQFGECKRKIKP